METWTVVNSVASLLTLGGVGTLFGVLARLHSKQVAALAEQKNTLELFASKHLMDEFKAMKEGLEGALEKAKRQLSEQKEASERDKAEQQQAIEELEGKLAEIESAAQESEQTYRVASAQGFAPVTGVVVQDTDAPIGPVTLAVPKTAAELMRDHGDLLAPQSGISPGTISLFGIPLPQRWFLPEFTPPDEGRAGKAPFDA